MAKSRKGYSKKTTKVTIPTKKYKRKVKQGPATNLSTPEFNVKEITKQLVLLEDHVADDDKFCMDCIRKHLIMTEALSEEAVALNPQSKWVPTVKKLDAQARTWLHKYATGKNKVDRIKLGKELRNTRKELVDKLYKKR